MKPARVVESFYFILTTEELSPMHGVIQRLSQVCKKSRVRCEKNGDTQ